MYKIVGADQKEYGPVTAEQILQWIREGRANAQTLVRQDDGPWKPLSTIPELAAGLPGAGAETAGPPAEPPTISSPPGYYSTPSPSSTNGMALTGLILGVLGVFQCCTPLFAVLGLIFSVIGFVQCRDHPALQSSRSLALGGIIASCIGLVIFMILVATGTIERMLRSINM